MRVAYTTIQDGGAPQPIEHDTTGGWVFNIRLISVEEKPRWQDTMKETYNDYDGGVSFFIGAQWDAHKATHHPPDAVDEDVTYRSVIIKKFR